MKKLFYFILLAGTLSCGPENLFIDCLPNNLQPGLIAFYPFHNGSLEDASGFSNNLSNPSTAISTRDRYGNLNCAFLFENTPQKIEYLTTNNTNFLNGQDAFTISLWYEPLDTIRSGGSFETLLGRGEEGRCPDRRGEWSVGLFDCRRAVFGHNNSVWANTVTDLSEGCQGEIVALSNKWHHVVAIKNRDQYQIYFNGILQETANGIANCSNMHLAQDLGDLFIGIHFNGRIDDVLIYNRALNSLEVTELYEMEPCCN